MTTLLCACAVVITLETQKCRKWAPRSVEFNFFINCDTENEEGDHRPRNSAQYERVVELLIMHKAKWTPRQISLLPSVSRPRLIIRQLRKSFRSCLMIDLGHETDGNTEICLGVHFALCIINCEKQKWFSQNERRRADLQNVASEFLIFAWALSYDLSKFSNDFTPFFRL